MDARPTYISFILSPLNKLLLLLLDGIKVGITVWLTFSCIARLHNIMNSFTYLIKPDFIITVIFPSQSEYYIALSQS